MPGEVAPSAVIPGEGDMDSYRAVEETSNFIT